MLIVTALLSIALAADCETLSKDDLIAALQRAEQAIQDEDVDTHFQVMGDLETRLPCLEVVIPSDAWARLLLGTSLVLFYEQADWQTPLATALYIDPSIDRLVGEAHPIYDWEPPPQPPPTDEVPPEGVVVFYDGLRVTKIPQPVGLHVVQRRDGDGLVTKLIRDEPIPEAWLVKPELTKRDWGWGVLSAGAMGEFGLLAQGQLGVDRSPGGGWSASTHGILRFYNWIGLRYDLHVDGLAGLSNAQLALGPSLTFDRGGFGLSADLFRADHPNGGADGYWLWAPSLWGSYHLKPSTTLSGRITGGPPVLGAALRLDQRLGDGAFRPTLGVQAAANRWRLTQPTTTLNTSFTDLRLIIEFGLAWGKSS